MFVADARSGLEEGMARERKRGEIKKERQEARMNLRVKRRGR